ncbi:hypothetical protein D9M71_531460 [compost metagenome]
MSLTRVTLWPSSSATSWAVSWSSTWLMVAGVPSLNMNLMTSAALTDICAARSPTVMVSPICTSRITGPVGFWKPWALRFFSLPLPRPPRRKPSLSSSVVRGAERGAGAFSFSLTEARCGAFLRSPSPRRASSLRGLSGRRGSSFLRSTTGAGAMSTTGAETAGAAAATSAATGACAGADGWRRASSSARTRASSSAF